MAAKEADPKDYIPDIIVDPNTGTVYKKGRFFGKGGFAKCYEITDTKTGADYAGKVIPNKLLTKTSSRSKVIQEITIHKSLDHKNVVGFHCFFEYKSNLYIVLELCRRRSMMELQRRRKRLTEPEARFYLHQVLLGVAYLHDKKIIHRDLKLGNLFLGDGLEVKLGDFGLATTVDYKGERKKTLCGTPNYIAPEVLTKAGHSFEVDVWSIGCILYTLLVGRPPFETQTLKETYQRIRECKYNLGAHSLSPEASSIIRRMLQPDPLARPTVHQLLKDKFFTSGYMPRELPVTCLTIEPRFDAALVGQRGVPEIGENKAVSTTKGSAVSSVSSLRKPLSEVNHIEGKRGEVVKSPSAPPSVADNNTRHLLMIKKQLAEVMKQPNVLRPNSSFVVETEDPAAQPLVWVSTWVDYTDKYGFGYQLCDDSVSVAFNDGTRLLMLANDINLHYIERDGKEHYHTATNYPSTLTKKMKLLDYFRRYMVEHLVKAGGARAPREADSMARVPYLSQWFRSRNCVIMFLTNGTLQINFSNHNKLIICPLMEAVTLLGSDNVLHTHRFSTIKQHGCGEELYKGLETALSKVQAMLSAIQARSVVNAK